MLCTYHGVLNSVCLHYLRQSFTGTAIRQITQICAEMETVSQKIIYCALKLSEEKEIM